MMLTTTTDVAAAAQRDSLSAPYAFQLRTNLIYGATLTPNLGFDYRIGRRSSLGLNAGFNPFPLSETNDRKWRHLLLAPELRFWGREAFETRQLYFGLNGIYSHFNVSDVKFPFGLYKSVRDGRLQGDLAALGIFVGYTWRLGRTFRLEAEAGIGGGYSWAKEYDCGHCGSYRGTSNKPFLVPKLALNIVLDPRRRHREQPEQPEQPATVVAQPAQPAPDTQALQPSAPVGFPNQAPSLQTLLAENPVVCRYSDYQPYNEHRVMRRDSAALTIFFPTGSATVDRSFSQNGPMLDRIVSVTRQILASGQADVRLIQVVGFASIEGPQWQNEQLGQQRAEALKAYVLEQVPEASRIIFELNNGGEAWTELRDQLAEVVAKTTDADLCRLLQDGIDLIDSEPDADQREQRLRQLHGGQTYRYINRELLPELRNSGYLKIFIE